MNRLKRVGRTMVIEPMAETVLRMYSEDLDGRCMFCLEPPHKQYDGWESLRDHIAQNHIKAQ